MGTHGDVVVLVVVDVEVVVVLVVVGAVVFVGVVGGATVVRSSLQVPQCRGQTCSRQSSL